jgi:hypothetical protein
MTRNQKIALGCGGAGCLGLIVVVIAGVLIYFFAYRTDTTNRNDDDNFNITSNRNSNSNDNSDSNSNDNSSSSSTNSSSSASSMSDDEKHKLYQAAMMTGDPELLRRVSIKLGLMDDDYTPGADYNSFVASHVTWAIRNGAFIQSLDTPAKARDYVDQNIPN